MTRTLLEVFPHTSMFLDGYYLALVSTKQPLTLDTEILQRRCSNKALAELLDEAGLDSPFPLLATFVTCPQTLARFSNDYSLNTEDHPIIEFETPRLGDQLNSSALAAETLGTLSLLQEPLYPTYITGGGALRQRLLQSQQARWTARQALIEKCYGRHIKAAKLFQEALAIDPTDDLARYEMESYLVAHAKQCVQRGLLRQAHRAFRQAVRVNPRSIGALASLATMEQQTGNFATAQSLWGRAASLDPHNQEIRDRIAASNNTSDSRQN